MQSLEKFLLSRRHLLQGAAGLSVAAAFGKYASAAPEEALKFVGWQYQPQMVEEKAHVVAKLCDENVTYDLVPGDYHPVVETRLTGGQHYDMMYSEEDHIARWK